MVLLNIPLHKFKEVLERETKLRDDSPEHTLDWYTYNNRVMLLEEIQALQMKVDFTESAKKMLDEHSAKKVQAKAEPVKKEAELVETKKVEEITEVKEPVKTETKKAKAKDTKEKSAE